MTTLSRAALVLGLGLVCVSLPAFADEGKRRTPRIVDGWRITLIDADRDLEIPRHAGLQEPIAVQPWTAATMKKRYDMDDQGTGGAILNEVAWPVLGFVMDDFDNEAAERIASVCKSTYAGNTWKQIHCATAAVNFTLDQIDYGPGGGDGPGARSFCRDHARAFEEVIDAMDLPYVKAGTRMLDTHIVNTISIVPQDSKVHLAMLEEDIDDSVGLFNASLHAADGFTYVIDVGWDPSYFWPLNGRAKAYHDANRDLESEVDVLPVILGDPSRAVADAKTLQQVIEEIVADTEAIRAAYAMQGNNATRYQPTAPAGTVTGSGSSSGSLGAGSAGLQR